jgi:hypothetical protein
MMESAREKSFEEKLGEEQLELTNKKSSEGLSESEEARLETVIGMLNDSSRDDQDLEEINN